MGFTREFTINTIGQQMVYMVHRSDSYKSEKIMLIIFIIDQYSGFEFDSKQIELTYI